MLSFTDAYSSYNQIKMNPLNVYKTNFMINKCNYYYKVRHLVSRTLAPPIKDWWTRCFLTNMKIPTTSKEVQQLTGWIIVLSCFISSADDKAFDFCHIKEVKIRRD